MEFSYGIIGNGKVATHLKRYFSLKAISYKNHSIQCPNLAVFECDYIILAISDSSIESFVKENLLLLEDKIKRKRIVHLSGALTIDGIISCHPLMTFSNGTSNQYDLDLYQKIPFVLDQEDKISFQEIFPELPNPFFTIKRSDRALYHALLVFGGNFPTILFQKFFEEFQKHFAIPQESLLLYIEQIFKNISTDYKNALTGPLARKDIITINKNIDALGAINQNYQEIYSAFLNLKGIEI